MGTLSSEKYVSFTTFRRDGTPVSTPVWIVDLGDGRVSFTTASSTWKVKRLSRDDRATLQAADRRGKVKPGSTPVPGTAEVVRGETFDQVRRAAKAKYGLAFAAATMVGKVAKTLQRGSGTDCAVIITLEQT